MIGYAMLGTNDLDRSGGFYAQILARLGGREVEAYRSDKRIWFSDEAGGPPMVVITRTYDEQPATVGNGSMLALTAERRDQVDAVYAEALALGATDEGAPGLRGDDPAGFYGAYFRDLDGNKLCVFRVGPA